MWKQNTHLDFVPEDIDDRDTAPMYAVLSLLTRYVSIYEYLPT